jgi:hypothetical protein
MSEPEPMDELSADLRTLLSNAKVLDAPAEAKARIRMRLVASLPPDPGSGGESAPQAPAAPTLGLPRAPLWTLAATLAIGAVGGFAVGARLVPQERIVFVDRPAVSAPAATASATALVSGVRPEDLPKAPPTATTSAQGFVAQDLGKERELLDIAKVALGRGEAQSALTRIDEHARLYPRGALAEEREALAVQALVTTGRSAEAKARATRFGTTYPKSVLLPAVRASVGETP